jgi:hypothetical protein
VADTPTPKAGAPKAAAARRREPPPGQSRLIATAVLAGAIFIAGAIAAVGLDDDDTVVIAPTTTTDPTATTVAGSTGTTSPTTADTAGITTTTAPGPATTAPPTTSQSGSPTTAPPSPCGSGNVVAQPQSGELTQDGDGWHLPVSATVTSQFDRSVEILTVIATVEFVDGSTQDVNFDTGGTTLVPGGSATFGPNQVDSDVQPRTVRVTGLAYQPAGQPECRTSA